MSRSAVATSATLCTFVAVLTIAATVLADTSTETNCCFDRLPKGPALIEAIASPGVDGLVDRKASTCSSSKNCKDCVGETALFVKTDMMKLIGRNTVESTGIIVPDDSEWGTRYIDIMGVHDTEATSSHADDSSQAAAPP